MHIYHSYIFDIIFATSDVFQRSKLCSLLDRIDKCVWKTNQSNTTYWENHKTISLL